MKKGAVFSPCKNFRYSLWRIWEEGDTTGRCVFIGLNPSTATETDDDPTIRRCINFAKDWGYTSLFMLNAYAFRATNPKDMKKGRRFADSPVVTSNPIGVENDESIVEVASQAGIVIAAWGGHCAKSRAKQVFHLVTKVAGQPLRCLGVNDDGSPKHPLYVKGETEPSIFPGVRN